MKITTEVLTALLAKVAYNRITLRKLRKQVALAANDPNLRFRKPNKVRMLTKKFRELESLYERQELLVEKLVNHPETGEFNEDTLGNSLDGYLCDNVLP